MTNVGIIGMGWVGGAMNELFPDAAIYDPYIPTHASEKDKQEVNKSDVAFICVPTPLIDGGRLDVSIVKEVIEWCKCPLIVIRSTLNPGDCDNMPYLPGIDLVYQPEYLGETPAHPLLDPKTRPFLIIGGKPKARKKLIELYTTVYNANISIRQVTCKEAEVIKLSENRAIAFKVAQCQELYDVCEKAGVDYYTVIQAVYGDDPRFNLWWTMIYPDNRGMNSKCIPKDVYAWKAWAESVGYDPEITGSLLERNKKWISPS
ncbi:MAG: hypothetical protein NUV69_00525 [Candidatus Curtissbacteria bacterium]|nr:hypothetical protein [Candidatus Curtissbacteria bacterium]